MNSYSTQSDMQITTKLSSKSVNTKIVLIRNSFKEKKGRNREGEERALRKEAKTYAEKG